MLHISEILAEEIAGRNRARRSDTRHVNRLAVTVSDKYKPHLSTHCRDDSVTPDRRQREGQATIHAVVHGDILTYIVTTAMQKLDDNPVNPTY